MTNSFRPRLVVAGAAAAIEFYQRAFGAEVLQRFDNEEEGTVAFAELRLLGSTLSLKDADRIDQAAPESGAGVLLDVTADDPDSVVDQSVQEGASMVFPVGDQPYGGRGGRVRDPFGHQWVIQTS